MTVMDSKSSSTKKITPSIKLDWLVCDIGVMLFVAGILCFFTKAMFVSSVAESGFLEEKFFLLPIGYSFILCASLCFTFTLLMTMFTFFKAKEKTLRRQCLCLILVCLSALAAASAILLFLLWVSTVISSDIFSIICMALSAVLGIAAFFIKPKKQIV